MQNFKQVILMEEPVLCTMVQCTCGQVLCVRNGTVIKLCQPGLAPDALIAAADSGNVLVHTSTAGAIISTDLQPVPSRARTSQILSTSNEQGEFACLSG